MEVILLTVNGHDMMLTVHDGVGKVESALPRETCPYCNLPDCTFSCDQSQGLPEGEEELESEDEVYARLQYNASVDALESAMLAHAVAGIDVKKPEYVKGVETALEAVANRLM
jgi:hypothetical protein